MVALFTNCRYICVFPFILLLLKLCNSSRVDMNIVEQKTFDFDVKPGGLLQEHEESWGSVTCKFIYACQGGTKELWSLSFMKNEDGSEYVCSVERPSGVSYLFFEKFEFQIKGASTKEVAVIGESGKDLMSSEYIHKKRENKVVYDEDFRSHLTKVELYGHANKKREL